MSVNKMSEKMTCFSRTDAAVVKILEYQHKPAKKVISSATQPSM